MHTHTSVLWLWISKYRKKWKKNTMQLSFAIMKCTAYIFYGAVTCFRKKNNGMLIVYKQGAKQITSDQCPWICLQCVDAVGWVSGRSSGRKNWVVGYWRGYLSGVWCKWFAYGPADATATPSSLASLKSRLTQVVLEKRLLNVCVCVSMKLYHMFYGSEVASHSIIVVL